MRNAKLLAAVAVGVMGWAAVVWGQVSMEGIKKIAGPGLPGGLSVWGEEATVLVTAPDGGIRLPVVAVGTLGKGRVAVFAHDGFLAEGALGQGDTRELMRRVMGSLGGGKEKVKVGAVGRKGFVKAMGLEVADLGDKPWENLGACDVLVVQGAEVPKGKVEAVVRFIEAGGGVLMADTGWGWAQLNPDRSLVEDHGGNQVLRRVGIGFTTATTGTDEPGLIVVGEVEALAHARMAIRQLEGLSAKEASKERKAQRALASAVVLSASDLALPGSAFSEVLKTRLADVKGGEGPTPSKPLDETRPFERVACLMEMRRLARLPVEQVVAHPAAAAFPGGVPEGAARVERNVKVDLAVPRWRSTGLYAAAGEKVTVVVPGGVGKGQLRVRIGAHTDNIEHLPVWKRVPEISRSFALVEGENVVASPYGGAVYIEVMKAGKGEAEVVVKGAALAPMFVLGETTAEQWKVAREAPAPWAEFVVPGRVVLTFRSESVREMEDPTAVLEHWKKVLDAMAELKGIPKEREFAERIVTDVQISAGYMHSGYPIMTHLDVSKSIVDLKELNTVKGGWGFYHELGHNHQEPEWTFEGTGEVTNNVFVHYVLETVCGLPVAEATSRALGQEMKRMIAAQMEKPDFARWQREPFLALAMYAQVHTTFGWEPFKKVLREYEAMTAEEKPKSQQARRDEWMVRLSRAVGRNLGPFFDAWGVPVTAEAKGKVAELPGWMP